MAKEFSFFVNGEWKSSEVRYELRSPYKDRLIGIVHRACPEHVKEAIHGAVEAFGVTRKYASFERAEILGRIVAALGKRRDDLARTIVLEAGKCIKHAEAEVDRAICTFTIAMEEAGRMEGSLLPLDILPANRGRVGIVRRFPVGPISGITPFNFPLNLVAHKLAPAIAAGNPMVLKPATQTPLSSLKLAEIVQEAGLVPGGFSVVTASATDAAPLVEDRRIKKLSFTGSSEVGWELKRRCGKKRITLELGGNAACIVHEDGDIELALKRCLFGAFAYQGQICIHLQRLLLHESIYERFKEAFLEVVGGLRMGDPMEPDTDIGPMISEKDAIRVERWVNEAEESGARILLGGKRRGSMFEPTVIEDCDPRQRVSDWEVFGPVVVLYRYKDFDRALEMVNDSRYGLQAGVFTRDIELIWKAFEELEVGGVMVNEVPTFRVDNQPYGGIKDSGLGREGVRYAIEEMTELKILMLNLL